MPADASSRRQSAHGRIIRRDDFRPCPWLPGPHLATIWASACRRLPELDLEFERVELSDGDFLDLAWITPASGPLVVVLHGLEGSHNSKYARGILLALAHAGFRAVLMQFRGCSGEPNRLDRSYHSGETGDFAQVAALLEARFAEPLFAAIGYSLGANVLLKWLGEHAAGARLSAAVGVSVPFDLGACADRLNQGFSRIYEHRLVRSMQQKYTRKFAQRKSPLDLSDVRQLDTFWKFDDGVTAPLHGFRDVHDYYRQSSCRQYLHAVTVQTLILHALDDPFVPPHAIPTAAELGPDTTLELCQRGGHVAFIGQTSVTQGGYWLEPRIVEFLNTVRNNPTTTRYNCAS